MAVDVIDDLVAEQDRLAGLLAGLTDEQWNTGSGAPGWTIADVVLHLAQSDEAVVASVTGSSDWPGLGSGGIDAAMDRLVRAERAAPAEVFARWSRARRAAADALRGADPATPVAWAAAPLKPATLATTRLAEHWAHGLDITEPLGLPFPDGPRLRHVAWLGVNSLPYAFALRGKEWGAVHCELTAPDGTVWRYGPAGAGSRISGDAGAFCRVGAQRLAPERSGLVATGPHGPTALAVLRNYAG